MNCLRSVLRIKIALLVFTGCTIDFSGNLGKIPSQSDEHEQPLPISSDQYKLEVENMPDGTGTQYSEIQLYSTEPGVNLFAIKRDPQTNQYLENPEVNWTLIGSMGNLLIQDSGRKSVFLPTNPGVGQIKINVNNVTTVLNVTVLLNRHISALPDLTYTNQNQSVTFSLIANDMDPDADPLVIAEMTQATYGTIMNNNDGSISYTPHLDFYGQDSITYTVIDNKGGSGTAVAKINVMTPHTWIGNAGDDNWSNDSADASPGQTNWCGVVVAQVCSGGSKPAASHKAVFDNTCENCNATINEPINISGLELKQGYTGVITQAPGQSITIGAGNLSIESGTLQGSDALIDLNGLYVQSGGVFNSTTGEFRVGRTGSSYGYSEGFVKTGGVFSAANGSLIFDGTGSRGTGSIHNNTNVVLNSPITVKNLEIDVRDSNSASYNRVSVSIGTSIINVTGDLTHRNGVLLGINGTINLGGSLIVKCLDGFAGDRCAGNASYLDSGPWIRMNSGGTQYYEADPEARTAKLAIDNNTTVIPTLGTTHLGIQRFSLNSGTFTAPSVLFEIGEYRTTGVSASDGFVVGTGSTFFHNSGTTKISANGQRGALAHHAVGIVDVPGSIDFHHLEIDVVDNHGDYNHIVLFIGADDILNVLGNLTFRDGILSGGNIHVAKDIYVHCADGFAGQRCAGGGTTAITLQGTTDQHLFRPDNDGFLPTSSTLSMNNPGNTIYVHNDFLMGGLNQSLNLMAGILNLDNAGLGVSMVQFNNVSIDPDDASIVEGAGDLKWLGSCTGPCPGN